MTPLFLECDASNNISRSTLISGQMDDDYTGVPRLTPHYIVNNLIPNAYTYGTPTGWIPGQQQISSQQTTYMHPNTYEVPISFPQQSQQGSGAMQHVSL
jgi:hypothetical protein